MWTANFRRACLSNLCIFISLYMLIPVLPVAMTDALSMPLSTMGVQYLVMMLGVVLAGPFCNYLMDLYSRKTLSLFTFSIVLIITVGYTFVCRSPELFVLAFVQGIAFGVTTTSLITLSIDITLSSHRSKGNLIFGWFTGLGLLLGAATGNALYLNYNFETVIIASVLIGLLGILFISGIRIPFRAPIGTSLCSLDRFILPHSIAFAFNTLLLAFIPGILLPVVHFKMQDLFWADGWAVPYLLVSGAAFLLSLPFVKLYNKSNLSARAIVGISTIIVAMGSLVYIDHFAGGLCSAILLGVGLSIALPVMLYFFIDLSSHCQRGTANSTHLLSLKLGLSIGVAVSCMLADEHLSHLAYRIALMASVLALICFALVSRPYHQKKKVR